MKMESPIEKSALPCISIAMEPLPFGQSHWDYLPVEIQEHILDLAAKSLHREHMRAVCRSIQENVYWLESRLINYTVRTLMENYVAAVDDEDFVPP